MQTFDMIRLCCLVIVVQCTNTTLAQSFQVGSAESPTAGTLFAFPERIALKEKGMFTCQRGLLFVPLNRSRKTSDVIAVEFFRFPRRSEADPQTPPIFILKGGPGFEGLEADLNKLGTLERRYFHFLEVSDVVVVGQRGIGSSKPNTVIEQNTGARSAVEPYDDAKAVNAFRKGLSRERQFWIEQGVDLSGFNVKECAADVRDLATALGYKQISLYGGSFGSHWGMAIMRSFPDLVARAVLTGLEGPDHTWDHPGWIWNVYKRVASEAEASEALRNRIPAGGLIATMESLVQRAKQKPFKRTVFRGRPNEATVLIDGQVMQRISRGISGKLRDWPAEVIQMSEGNFSNAVVFTLMRTRQRRSFATASEWMINCGSGVSPKRRAEIESDPAVSVLGNINWTHSAGNPIWNNDLGDEFRTNFETDIPTVIVHGTWDTSTPFENALELAPYFNDHKFVTIKRGSHGALLQAESFDQRFRPALLKFLTSGDFSALPNEITLPAPRWTVPK